ncbi:MAG TPA: polyprenyl diphosphate synthase [Rectinemataceae bacterium]
MQVLRIPSHLAIIMDGNGRWANARGLPRAEGHRQGLSAAKRVVLAASARGVQYLSLYTFSTENWKRTSEEVGFLMGLIRSHLSAELDFYRANRIRVVHSGSRKGLDPDILAEIDKVCGETAALPGMVVNLAINYGGRDEILRSFSKALNSAPPPGKSIEEVLRSGLDHPEIPDPDLIIRTGGELRLSNFLLWESAYSELYFCDTLWPDFGAEDLDTALSSYARRERRFGGRE